MEGRHGADIGATATHATFLGRRRNARPRGGCSDGKRTGSSSEWRFTCPRREPELPEGTDHIVAGASAPRATARRLRRRAAGGSARHRPAGEPGRATRSPTCAARPASKIRAFADDGKGRATGLLDDFSEVITDAARSVDERLGEEYGEYAHRAAGAVSAFAGKVRDKSVDESSTTPANSSARAPASRSASPRSPASP